MAIQVRRGNEVDFDPSKMLPGEWAVSLDTKYVRMCFSPGVCLRMATYEAFEADMAEIQSVLMEARSIQEAVARIQTEINDTAVVVEDYSILAKSYAVGGTGKRENEDSDNAKYYYEQAKRISQSGNGLIPLGTIAFENLPTEDILTNGMYNISNDFTSDERFLDGGGVLYGKGSNVYYTVNGLWDVLAASDVKGVKGANETTYRQGNVSLSAEDVGAIPKGNTISTLDNKVQLISNNEGGNITLIAPNGRVWEIDAVEGDIIRIFRYTEDVKNTDGVFSFNANTGEVMLNGIPINNRVGIDFVANTKDEWIAQVQEYCSNNLPLGVTAIYAGWNGRDYGIATFDATHTFGTGNITVAKLTVYNPAYEEYPVMFYYSTAVGWKRQTMPIMQSNTITTLDGKMGFGTNNEGGNLWWTAPDGSMWEIDAYASTLARLFRYNPDGSISSFEFNAADGSIGINGTNILAGLEARVAALEAR